MSYLLRDFITEFISHANAVTFNKRKFVASLSLRKFFVGWALNPKFQMAKAVD